MGLKKRSLSRSGAANQLIIATKDGSSWYPVQSAIRKGLGFFGHVAWQASGWSETVDRQPMKRKRQRRLSSRSKLQRRQLRINPAFSNQLVVFADFYNMAFVEHDDAISFLDGGQAVRNDKSRAVLHGAL
jgi:hypothetical protein